MRDTKRIDSLTYPMLIQKMFKALVHPPHFLVLGIFIVLYGPFLLKYGWNYRNLVDIDLPSFYAASISVFERGESPYDTERLQKIMNQDGEVFPYLYPPPSLFFFYPLSALNFTLAHRAVLLFNHLLFLLLIWAIPLYLIRPFEGYRLTTLALSLVVSLTFFPVFSTLAHGQVNFLLLAFLLLAWLLGRKERPGLAGFFLALAILLKTYPILILPLLCLSGRWKECASAAGWLALAFVISILVLPDRLWGIWLSDILPAGGYASTAIGSFSPADISNHSLNGFFARTFMENEWSEPITIHPGLARLLTYASALLVVTIAGITAWRSRGQTDRFDRTLLISLPTMYLIAPFSWEHHLVYLLPVILILPHSRSSFASLSGFVFLLLWLGSTVLSGVSHFFEYKFFAVLILWALSIATAWSKHTHLWDPDAETSAMSF